MQRDKREKFGLLLGLVGVICFSLTLPSTSIAVEYFGTTVVGLGRTVVAAILVAVVLIVRKEKLPSPRQFKSLLIVAVGAVLGFPLLTSWAMEFLPVSHGAVELALLPLATTGFAMFRAKEIPSLKFWISSIIGSLAVIVYALHLGFGQLQFADLALLAAVIILGLSYAEGGILAKELGSWQVIAWAIMIGAPFFVIPVGLNLTTEMLNVPIHAWISFIYLAVVSQFLAYVAWYSGMAMGGIARVSQIQYLQPFLMILFAAAFLNESITLFTLVIAVIVVFSVILGKNAPVSKKGSVSEKN
ncbi:DMT family transporter [Heyndrickxia oleronia]|uniref:Multidrug transporter n=1 Tax=Heyndrickxia oleronia TaxID=38875 RepID=A0A8E2LCY7_9BACI|nr:DMT family transporter [Heyndrickxia oleronia]NYV65560.1 DMT family transporter [Bacillus sp. Gen3]OJH20513.1 multidrug transporter [Bacillus obstructivus]MBU5210210.1 DMT family transporter [Heyndrickxia oleronia]MCM3453396.1 DMT family transporter [Heyndrickxia oleronia]MEC1377165.1 DMT family transporter [Heyndrickxia oleronia]